MNTKQFFIVAAAAAFAPFAFSVAAECGDDEAGHVKTGYAQVAENSSHKDQEKSNHKDNDNSNRQSDPDSTRGQERAEERRGEKNFDSRDDSKDDSKEDRAWYDPRGLVDRIRENPWYDPLGLFS